MASKAVALKPTDRLSGGVSARQVPLRHEAWSTALLVIAGAVIAALALRIWKVSEVAEIQQFTLIAGSLLVEAVPFVLLGAIVSAAIEVFVPVRFFASIARLPKVLQVPAAALLGVAFPVCECGSIPVARRLAVKGLSAPASITFMLAAPLVNPIVVFSTALAYRGRSMMWPMVLGRLGLGLATAMIVGWFFRNKTSGDILREQRVGGHDHCHVGESKRVSYFGHLASDFMLMAPYLLVGVSVAAATQTFLPQSALKSVAASPLFGMLALMLLAFVLSLCSESDAFVAASFVQFGYASQLAFLVMGPMLDVKLAFMYSGAFSRRFVVIAVAGIITITLAGSLLFGALFT